MLFFITLKSTRSDEKHPSPSVARAGAALGIYEELQLWDALVLCYRLLGKKGAAEDLLKRRLKVNSTFLLLNFTVLLLLFCLLERLWGRVKP